MEPTSSNNSNTPQNFTFPESNPEKKPGFSRKKQLLVLGLAVLAIIVGITLVALNSGKKDQDGQKSSGNVYYDRPGFDRSKMSDAIGDPAALITKPNSKTVSYKGSPVIQACNLLTVEEIRGQGLQLNPNSLTAFERSYFDGQSEGALVTYPTSLGSMEDSNSCMYPLNDSKGTISIDVYQPTYNQPSAINYELRRYSEQGSIAGLTRYERTVEDSTYYLLRDGDSAVQVQLRKVADKGIAEKFLTKVAENYNREKAAPAGPLEFAYDSPVFKKSYLNSCSIIAADDVKQLFGGDVKPLVTERVATATGVIYYSLTQDATRYSRIEHECIRRAVSNGFSNRKSLTAETTSFMTDEAAKLEMQSGRRLDSNVRTVSTKIGDDVYFSDTTGNNPEMVIRKGRFVINLGLYNQTQPNISSEESVRLLTPIAQSVVSRIQD